MAQQKFQHPDGRGFSAEEDSDEAQRLIGIGFAPVDKYVTPESVAADEARAKADAAEAAKADADLAAARAEEAAAADAAAAKVTDVDTATKKGK